MKEDEPINWTPVVAYFTLLLLASAVGIMLVGCATDGKPIKDEPKGQQQQDSVQRAVVDLLDLGNHDR